MRTIDQIRHLYTHDGPFATVYLDATRASENAAHEVDLRWRDARGQLEREGADEATVAALDDAVQDADEPGPHGRVLVAAHGSVLFDRPLADPPAVTEAHWDALPVLMPYLGASTTDIAHIVVVADRTGADIDVVLGAHAVHASVAGNEQHPIHKTRRNQWNERHFQNRVDNAWAENARDVATEVAKHAGEVGAELIVLAGDERAVSMLQKDLREMLATRITVATADSGGRAAGSSDEALHSAVRDEVLKFGWRRRRELLEHLQQNLGRGAFARAGADDVMQALRMSQADVIVVVDDSTSARRAWIGSEPLQVGMSEEDLRGMGVTDPREVSYEEALVRAAVGGGADVEVTPNEHHILPDGVGALLRFDEQVATTSGE